MPVTLSQTEDAIMTELRTFLLSLFVAPLPEVIQAQSNRVPEPVGSNYIVMTPLDRLRLATNVETWDFAAVAPTTIAARYSTAFKVQLDIHGEPGGDWGQIITTCFHGDYAFPSFPETVKPLYADSPRQMPFLNGEHQYENRWVVILALQVAPIVSTSMQFAATLTPTLILVTGED